MSLNYDTDNNITIDDQPLMSVELKMMSDSACLTDIISCTSTKHSSLKPIDDQQSLHDKKKLHKCSTCDKCFVQKGHLN